MMNGLNIDFPIYYDSNGSRMSFHNLKLNKAVVDSVVMSLSDKITGEVVYNGSDLAFTMQEYVLFNDVKYYLVNPPTILREGLVKDNSDLKGMTKYSLEFYHPMWMLGNFPFTDVAVSFDELRYKSQDKTFSWIGKPQDFVNKLNKNLEGTEFVVVLSDSVSEIVRDTLSEVLSFDNATIADALKDGYDTWGLPYVVDKLNDGEMYDDGTGVLVDYYDSPYNKRFVIVFGLPANEIYASASAQQQNNPFVFRFGRGLGLKNHSRNPRNNKIVTRIAGYGSENNIPYGYPQVLWLGNQDWDYTINNESGMQPITVNGETITAMSYPIYKGIVGGEYVKLIKHPFTRKHLMPSVYAESVFNKVSQYTLDENENVISNTDFDPNIEIVDYYDATSANGDFPNQINISAPSYEIHEFEDIKPELGEEYILGANPVNADLTDADGWDDTMDDDGNYLQSYFKITLPRLSFDIYACAAITQEMQINMRSGACIGCTFTVQVDWEDYKVNFYDSNNNFAPQGSQRDFTRYPNSKNGSITVVVQKDINTFGTLMPNIYQYPASGDQFVILGISLPLSYIESAQERLDTEMKSYMLENNVYYYDYPLKFDEYYLANHTYVLNQIRPNTIIRFNFNSEPLELFVKQMTIKYHEDVLPQYDITLTDNIEVVLNQIGRVADDVEHLSTLISLLRQSSGNVYVELARKLSKVNDDTASGLITFLRGLVSNGNADFTNELGFSSGWLTGNGARIDNQGNAEFESVKVRGSMTASELIFNLISAEEGESIRSIGHGTIETVHINQNGTSGYFTLKLEGDEVSTVKVGDICRGMYNNIGRGYSTSDGEDINGFRKQRGFFTSYFSVWSISNQTDQAGNTYQRYNFTLQTTDKDGNSVTTPPPCVGMKFVVYGNLTNSSRRSSMYISAVGQSPKLLFLTGVNNYWILPENIKIALGDVSGIDVWIEVTETEYNNFDGTVGVNKKTWSANSIQHWAVIKELEGSAGFYCENNIYLGGVIEQFKSAAMDAITAELANVGQARVTCNYDSVPIDCDENGVITEDFSLSLEATLWLGSTRLTITSFTATMQGVSVGGAITNNVWMTDIDFDEGSTLSSGVVSISLTGADANNNSYTATKTVSIIANRQGATGRAVAGAISRVQTWGEGNTYYKGDSDEPYVDIVIYNNAFWRCIFTHVSQSTFNNAYWQQANNFNFVATDILLADQAAIRLMFSQKIMMTDSDNRLTATINDDEKGSYCIYYPESGARQFEFSSTRSIICYNDDSENTMAWWLGNDGVIHKTSGPTWSSIWLYRFGNNEPSNNSFTATTVYELTKHPVYIAGNTSTASLQAKNGKIYPADYNTLNLPNNNYIDDGWYTDEKAPIQVISTIEGTDMWELQVLHIESGSITERKAIYTTNSGS